MGRSDIKRDLGRMDLKGEVNVQSVERVQDRQKALSEIIETFLQELLAGWWKSVTGVPDRGTGKPANHRRKIQILVRFGVEKISAGSRRSFHGFCCTLPHAFGMPITPDPRRAGCLLWLFVIFFKISWFSMF